MKKILFYALAGFGVLGAVVCGVQTAIAIQFGELGRVFVYLLLLLLCGELAGYSVYRIVKDKNGSS